MIVFFWGTLCSQQCSIFPWFTFSPAINYVFNGLILHTNYIFNVLYLMQFPHHMNWLIVPLDTSFRYQGWTVAHRHIYLSMVIFSTFHYVFHGSLFLYCFLLPYKCMCSYFSMVYCVLYRSLFFHRFLLLSEHMRSYFETGYYFSTVPYVFNSSLLFTWFTIFLLATISQNFTMF